MLKLYIVKYLLRFVLFLSCFLLARWNTMHNLQRVVKEIVSHKNLHLNVVPSQFVQQLYETFTRGTHLISTTICPAIWMTTPNIFELSGILLKFLIEQAGSK